MAQVHDDMSARGSTDAITGPFVICSTRSGKTIFASKPRFDDTRVFAQPPQTKEDAFRAAANYAEFAREQDLYLREAKDTGATPHDLALLDWFGGPELLEIDVDSWTGKTGQMIRVKARDNVRVARVLVVIRNKDGQVLETGEAVRSEDGSAWWAYTTRSLVPMAPVPSVEAIAWDLPGNRDSFTID